MFDVFSRRDFKNEMVSRGTEQIRGEAEIESGNHIQMVREIRVDYIRIGSRFANVFEKIISGAPNSSRRTKWKIRGKGGKFPILNTRKIGKNTLRNTRTRAVFLPRKENVRRIRGTFSISRKPRPQREIRSKKGSTEKNRTTASDKTLENIRTRK